LNIPLDAAFCEDFIMISRRQAFAVTILGLIGGSTVALAQAKKGSSPGGQFDTDKDGTVDIDEAKKAASDLFDKLDTDKEGTLSIKELRGRLSSKDFAGADPDGDKTLTEDEYLAVVEKRFKTADTDNDGTVSAEEFRTPAGQALAQLLH
jgi:molecular chaperone DnaK (HSP70)